MRIGVDTGYLNNGPVVLPIAIGRIEYPDENRVYTGSLNNGPVVLPIAIGRTEYPDENRG
jgi:hypothetical protein